MIYRILFTIAEISDLKFMIKGNIVSNSIYWQLAFQFFWILEGNCDARHKRLNGDILFTEWSALCTQRLEVCFNSRIGFIFGLRRYNTNGSHRVVNPRVGTAER